MTNLQNDRTIWTLRDQADEDTASMRRLRGRAIRCALLGTTIAAILGTSWARAGAPTLEAKSLFVVALLLVLLVRSLHAWLGADRARRRLLRGRRWRHAPRATVGLSATATRLEASGPPLRAPLSGRACLGWEVLVSRSTSTLLESDHQIRLIEQRHCGFEASAASLGADQAWLSLRRQPYPPTTPGQPWPAHIAQFLRYRGLDTTEALQVFESIIPVDTECWLGEDERGRLHISHGARAA